MLCFLCEFSLHWECSEDWKDKYLWLSFLELEHVPQWPQSFRKRLHLDFLYDTSKVLQFSGWLEEFRGSCSKDLIPSISNYGCICRKTGSDMRIIIIGFVMYRLEHMFDGHFFLNKIDVDFECNYFRLGYHCRGCSEHSDQSYLEVNLLPTRCLTSDEPWQLVWAVTVPITVLTYNNVKPPDLWRLYIK